MQPFVATVAFVMYKFHLLLDDIAVVAAEGDERCLGVRECIELCSAFQSYTTVIPSQTNNYVGPIN